MKQAGKANVEMFLDVGVEQCANSIDTKHEQHKCDRNKSGRENDKVRILRGKDVFGGPLGSSIVQPAFLCVEESKQRLPQRSL